MAPWERELHFILHPSAFILRKFPDGPEPTM